MTKFTARFLCFCLRFAVLAGCGWLSATTFSFAQAPGITFKHINYDQGLSNSTIEAITQDSRGFIWIGTRDGLNLYDGYRMTVFRNEKGKPGTLSDNYITCLYTDKQNTLWVGTLNGLNRFDETTKSFTSYVKQADANSITGNTINCIMEDADKNMWICTNKGLDIFDRGSKKFSHITNPMLQGSVNYILQDNKKNIWIAADGGLVKYNPVTKSFALQIKDSGLGINFIQQGLNGQIWLATKGKGLIALTPDGQYKTYRHSDANPASLGNDQVLSLLRDKAGRIWAGTINGGLNLFNSDTETFTKYTYQPAKPYSLSQRTISAIFEDRQGNFWIGTHRGGVNLYNPGAKKFNVYRQEVGANSLSYNDVKCFEEDHTGRIWVGTDGGGLNLFNQQQQTFTTYRHRVNDAASLGSDAVLDITEDKQNRLWISTWGGGLNLMDPAAGTFTSFKNNPADPSSISSDYVQSVYQDKAGTLWVGTYFGGLNRFDPSTKKFSRVIADPAGKTKLQGNNIVALNEDADGNLWIGTDDGGLNCYRRQSQIFEHYFDRENKKPDLRVIFTDHNGGLWIGQSGLYKYDKQKNAFALFTTEAGLGHDFIKGLTEDDEGNLWVSTSNGLVKLNPATRHANKFNTSDGLQAMEFEVNAYMKTKNGQMFFGGINGFNAFYPRDIKSNYYVPPVYITDFQIFNRSALPGKDSTLEKDISLTDHIELNYLQSSISFSFAALNYLAPENNKYAYKLTDFDKSFNYTGTAPQATYTNLDPGDYTFTVKAANNDGVWNNVGRSITITITPPWWLTWWFRTLGVLFSLGLAYAIIRYRQNMQLKKLEEEKKEEVHQLQLQFFTNISHEFRTPLTLLLGPLEKLMGNGSQPEQSRTYQLMYRNATRLMNLINELMDFRKAESGVLKLNVTAGNITVFMNEITDEFDLWAEQKHIKFTLQNFDLGGKEVFFDRQLLEKILLNLINNAFKYTNDGGEITVKLFFDESDFKPSYQNELKITNTYQARQYMYILVADTGIGISADSIKHLFQRYYRITSTHLGSGIGLAFVKTLTLLHKGCINVYSERNKGTEILIALPVDEADYQPNERWISENKPVLLESVTTEWPQPTEGTDLKEQPGEARANAAARYILLVEDNTELRTFLKEILGSIYHVIEAKDGQEGLAMARDRSPNMIISDVMMPNMNGIELCKLIKSDEQTKHIPFILLTAKDSLEAKLEGIESGADFYFSKPVSINLLLLTIRNVFLQLDQLKERYTHDYQAEVKETVHSNKDKQFMDQLVTVIEAQLENPDLDVDYLCANLNMSRTKLYELIKRLTGQSIVEFIRTIRLNKAIHIMTHEDASITEIMMRVGIQTQAYFTKAFKKEFGKTPSQFLNDLKR
ncbi:response regulator [Mucilaginibacter sp. ZT4R22]|uniref:histidine kinase n=1 Tax=Mucilaginibacter pankratovii TaxID=2772110 RepID=A0ABR7WUW1_9SPHI|nr:two-component regulator propeller domain-containing protein [Mucilaginibacter pankratovii]MBD1366095.1 response regulator [Mucilaginibacter pankratovii]